MQILPLIELFPFIKHYLFLESRGADLKKLRLFSDGNTGIVFSSKNNLLLGKNNVPTERLPGSFLYGQITEFKDIYLFNETPLIIVVFQPAGMSKLLGMPANEIRDLIIRTEDVFGNKGLQLENKLSENITLPEKISILNSFFTGLLSNKTDKTELMIPAAVNFIAGNKGLISLPQLVKFTGYTERHIERKFMAAIGITPKRFINIVKLHTFLKHLNNKPADANLTQIVYEAGYADQSHLIKEFKKHTGMTPRQYKDKAYKVAVNFVAFLPSAVMSELYNLPAGR